MVAVPPPPSKRRQEQASCFCCRQYRRRRTRSVNRRAHRSTREPVSPTDPERPSGAKEPAAAARRDRETAMDDEEGRARYWIWPLRIHAVVSCKNRSSHRRDYLTSKESHQNSRHRRRQHRNPPGGEGAAMEATPSLPQQGRHQPCLHLQNIDYYTKN